MTELALIERAKAGDSEAMAQLYRLHSARVLDYLGWRVDRETAQDLASVVWMRVLAKLPSYQTDPRGLAPWLLTIARNLTADYYGSGRMRMETSTGEIPDSDDSDPTPDELAASEETRAEVRALLARAQLTPAQAEAIELRYLRGLDVTEAAQRMGLKEGAVKALTYRAVQTLRRIPHQHLKGAA